MRRRDLLKGLAAALMSGSIAPQAFAQMLARLARPDEPYAVTPGDYGDSLKDYLEKMRHFDRADPTDVFVDQEHRRVFESCTRRLERLERVAGFGKFQLLDLDEALDITRDYSQIGEFSKDDLAYLEMIFYFDATRYGFYDAKHLTKITDGIPAHEVVKVPHSGTYLYRGLPLQTYEKIRRDIGDQAILTSGVRGVMKQFYLFLRKAYDNQGNLSLASRSLAPPGYSFHGISDFDLGQAGLGDENFTQRFITTEVYRKLKELDYLNLRYPPDNLLGVRFEPWHIKVNWKA